MRNGIRHMIFLLLLLITGVGQAMSQGNASALIINNASGKFTENGITGAGTAVNPYVITTKEGLAYFSAVVYNAWTGRQGKYWRLDADIDMEGRLWDYGVKAQATNYFQGTFDGNGHTISNLRMEVSGPSGSTAFGFIPNLGGGTGANRGVLKNLTLDNVVMTQTANSASSAWYRVGIVVGFMHQHSLVENVHVTNCRIELSQNISASSGFVVSLLVANIESSTVALPAEISHCSVSASSIVATTPIQYARGMMVAVGGLVGSMPQDASKYSYVHHCVADDVTIDLTKLDCNSKSGEKYNLYSTRHSVGGVIGNLQTPHALPEHLYFSGSLNAPLAAVGPVVGTMTKSQGKPDYIFMDYSGENVDIVSLSDLSVGSTWYYHDYRLGVSQALLNQTERTLNFDPAEVADGYLTVTDNTFYRTNMLRTSRTLLAYRVSGSNSDFGIYPNYNSNSTSYPAYYMAYAQGVNRGKCIASAADAAAIKQALLLEGKGNLTLTDNDATLRGFDAHSLTIANTGGIAIDEYEWYQDGQKIAAAGTNAEIDRERDGRGVVVVAKKDGDIVASATARLNSASFRLKNPASLATAGTKENPYLLGGSYGDKELELLSYLSVLPNLHLWYGYNSTNHYNVAYYEMDGDIDLGAIERFTPIAQNVNANTEHGGYGAGYAFLGVFNGNGHAIRNAHIHWSAGDVYSSNAIRPWGIFGYVGGSTVNKVGEDVPSNTTIVNLIIDNVMVSHDPTNHTFAYSGTYANHCYVGTLAGLVAIYTNIANIEVRNSRITDMNDMQNYLLAAKQLSIGGVIGRMQGLVTGPGALANSIRTSSIVADVDIDINHAAFSTTTSGQHVRGLTIGGNIGSIEGQTDEKQVNWPQQTFFSGKVQSANAFVGPVFGSADIRATSNNEWSQFCGHYMGTSQTSSTGLKPTDPSLQMPFDKNYFDDYRIWYGGSYQPITDTYPSNTCADGARTLKAHSHANSSMYGDGDLYEYQGVNYGEYKNLAAMTDSEKDALEESMKATEGEALAFKFKVGADGKLHLAVNSDLEISLSDDYDGNTVEQTHTLTLSASGDLSANYVEWLVNGVEDAGQSGLGRSSSHYDVGNTEQSIVVNVYSDDTKTQLLATSNSVVIPAFTYSKTECVVFVNQKTGNNALDGLTIATAVKDYQTGYRRVRQLRERIGSANNWNTNFIVACTTGSYDTNTTLFHIEDEETKGGGSEPLVCTFTGSWDDDGTGHGITGGTIYIHLPISGDGFATDACVGADTRLTDIVIRGGQNSDNTRFSCNMHNVLFDTGITIQQFGGIASTQVEGANMPAITLLVTRSEYGINDDEIDLPDWVTSQAEPITIEIRSGRWARVMTGRLPSGTYASLKNRAILASPSKPLRARFIVDIQNDNPKYLDGNGKVVDTFSQDDIGLFCAGLTDGTVYADVTLDLRAGNVRLITGGNQGNSQTNASGRMPSASFFGRTIINMSEPDDGRETRVREIYLCGLGRNASSQNICNMFFYGQSMLNMNGGTVTRNVYGATSGGISGITDGKDHYTYDATIPYTSGTGNAHNGVTYGSFANNGIANVATMTSGLETIRLDYVKPVINIMGGTINGNIYGGGWGEANGLPAKQAMKNAGTHYGDVEINISGGNIQGSVYGGGAGSSTYFETATDEERDPEDFRHSAIFYGNSYIHITGGKVGGNIYGGGAGLVSKDQETEYKEIAKVYGTTNITIDNAGFTEAEPFHGNIYGGGAMGAVEGDTNITILDGFIEGDVFGAGQGEEGHPEKAKVTGSTNVTVGQE